MRKLLVCTLMIAAMAAFTGVNTTPTMAQATKKDKDKDSKKAKDAKPAGSIEIAEGKDGKFRFNVRDSEGKFLAMSGAFATEKDAKEAIDYLKEVISSAKVTTKKPDKDGK